MIGTLIESQSQVQRHNLGSVVSVAAHAIIASAVIATAARSTSVTKPMPVPIFRVAPPTPPPHERPASTAAVKTNVAGVPQMPSISVPLIIPTQIPAVDLTAVPTAADFIDRPSHDGDLCAFPCRGTTAADSALPVWAANVAMMQLREPPVAPRYPDVLRRAGIDGTVVVKFVVDTLGHVDMASMEVLSSSHDLFTAAVRETLAKLRFNPARVGERKVRAAAVMPFHFMLK